MKQRISQKVCKDFYAVFISSYSITGNRHSSKEGVLFLFHDFTTQRNERNILFNVQLALGQCH